MSKIWALMSKIWALNGTYKGGVIGELRSPNRSPKKIIKG